MKGNDVRGGETNLPSLPDLNERSLKCFCPRLFTTHMAALLLAIILHLFPSTSDRLPKGRGTFNSCWPLLRHPYRRNGNCKVCRSVGKPSKFNAAYHRKQMPNNKAFENSNYVKITNFQGSIFTVSCTKAILPPV
jgi:hypothetical protein